MAVRSPAIRPAAAAVAGLFEPPVWGWFGRTFQRPSPAQVLAWPAIAGGENVLLFSPTGSGKTLAAFLWCINDLFRHAQQGTLGEAIHVLYISPLKALGNDIGCSGLAARRRSARSMWLAASWSASANDTFLAHLRKVMQEAEILTDHYLTLRAR